MSYKVKGKYPWRFTGIGLLTFAGTVFILWVPFDNVGLGVVHTWAWWVLALTVVTLIARIGWWVRNSRSSQALIGKWTERNRSTDGMAGRRDHFMFTSKRAMRELAPQVRPTMLDGVDGFRLRAVPISEYATELVRLGGYRPPFSRKVYGGKVIYSSIEHHTLTIGPSGSGKSGSLACRILDAPGAVVAVSTTGDLYENTVAIRARRGPVLVMNLGGVAGIPNNLKWSVLVGCEDPQVAENRAHDMLPTEMSFGKSDQWKELAQGALAMLMHAAACSDGSMRTVYRWIANADDPKTYDEVFEALTTSREQKIMRTAAMQFFRNHKPTRDGIITAMTPALTWLRDSRIVSIGDAKGEDLFELANVLHQGGTIYIIGEETHTTSGLVTALISEIVRGARREATQMRRQRLDPPLAFCLDEAALVCWVPLHEWTAELRARGITIHIAIQARSQLRARWGDKNTDTIFTNCTAVIVYGGCKSPDDLLTYERLAGWREEKDGDGPGRRVPVLTTGEIASLEGGTALVFRRDMRPFLGRPKLVWDRKDYKRSRREQFILTVETDYEADMLKEEVA